MGLAVHISLFILSLIIFSTFYIFRGKKCSNRIPPGSFGLPVIGQTLEFLKVMKDDKLKEWYEKRIRKYGHVWKSHIFGYPTICLQGPKANKFVLTFDGSVLINAQPPSLSKIIGPKNILELFGPDHKRIRGAMGSFLKLDVLKFHVAKVDEEVRHHLQMHWHGKHEIKVQPLINTLTFNMICSLLFGIERGPKREKMLPHFRDMFEGVISIPIKLPFTRFYRGMTARKKLLPMIMDLIREREEALKQKQVDTHNDLISCLLSIHDDKIISNEEIVDNVIAVMAAGHELTATLVTFFIKFLATNKSIYTSVVQEQEEIAKNKLSGEALTWKDLTKMNYTWRVASEILRMYPPVVVIYRQAMKDIEYEGFIIPKGWKVILFTGMTHMDENIFQNPSEFNPARFEKHAPSPPAFSLVPFGAGSRMCPGTELAKMETLVMIHHLVTRFKWELLHKDESYKRIPMPVFDQGLLVRIKPIS